MANSSGNVEFVFEISEAEAAAQPELDWKALILESVPKLSSADQQELFAMLKHAAPDSLNSTWSTCSTPELQANSTCSTPELQADMVFVAADDNAIVRALSKQHLKSARSHPDSLILGATYKEARTVPSKVMELARKHGHNRVIALFDQNLDQYVEGSVFGSEMAQQLREQGFRGLICIRTSNKEEQHQDLLKMGVDLVVSKSSTEWPFHKVMGAIALMLDSMASIAQQEWL